MVLRTQSALEAGGLGLAVGVILVDAGAEAGLDGVEFGLVVHLALLGRVLGSRRGVSSLIHGSGFCGDEETKDGQVDEAWNMLGRLSRRDVAASGPGCCTSRSLLSLAEWSVAGNETGGVGQGRAELRATTRQSQQGHDGGKIDELGCRRGEGGRVLESNFEFERWRRVKY